MSETVCFFVEGVSFVLVLARVGEDLDFVEATVFALLERFAAMVLAPADLGFAAVEGREGATDVIGLRLLGGASFEAIRIGSASPRSGTLF